MDSSLGPIDALLHLLNLFLPALGLALLSAALAKLAWRRELASTTWWSLAWPAALLCALTTLGGLVAYGQDGRIGTYAAMALVCALTLWWRGFGRRA